MRISKIEPQKKNRKRSSIFIDGKFAFGLSSEVVAALDLHAGQELTEGEIGTIVLAREKEKVRERAFLLLRYHDRSSLELRQRLTRLGFDEPLVGEVVDELTADKTVDDARYLQEFISDYTKLNPKGNVFLAHQLRRKGIEPGLIEDAVRARDERPLVREYIERRLKGFDARDPRDRQKIIRRLVARGFTPRVVFELLADIG